MGNVPVQAIYNIENERTVDSNIPVNPEGTTGLEPNQEKTDSISPDHKINTLQVQPLIDAAIYTDKPTTIPSKVGSIASYTPENGKDNPAIAEKEFIDHINLDESSEKVNLPNGN